MSEPSTPSKQSQNRRFVFRPDQRLKKKQDFERAKRDGKKLYAKNFLVVAAPAISECSRFAATVTRKIDKRAVVRNGIQRRLREIFRLHRHRLVSNFDIIVIARHNAPDCSYAEMERQVLGTLRYHGLLR